MTNQRDVFQVIADPTRRAIINLLAGQPQNVNAIAQKFNVTRQAISLHVQIMVECGIIEVTKQGRERQCEVRLEKLSEVTEWVAQCKQLFEQKLDALEKYVEQLKKEKYDKQCEQHPRP